MNEHLRAACSSGLHERCANKHGGERARKSLHIRCINKPTYCWKQRHSLTQIRKIPFIKPAESFVSRYVYVKREFTTSVTRSLLMWTKRTLFDITQKRLGTNVVALKFHLTAQRSPHTLSNPGVFNLFWQGATAIVMD